MSTFSFKLFNIKQHQSAAKVGTDGVLLGAWTPILNEPKHVLDIGTGTGLVALMLAQRTKSAEIIGVEVDKQAAEEAEENFLKSPWSNRLTCENGDINNFESQHKFDLIVSNPPFYTDNTFAPNQKRNIARNTIGLDFKALVSQAIKLLSEKGYFCLIIPYKEEKLLIELTEKNGLFPFQIMHVRGHHNAQIKRSLIAFSRKKSSVVGSEMVIEESRHQYTSEYINLTKDFYLRF